MITTINKFRNLLKEHVNYATEPRNSISAELYNLCNINMSTVIFRNSNNLKDYMNYFTTKFLPVLQQEFPESAKQMQEILNKYPLQLTGAEAWYGDNMQKIKLHNEISDVICKPIYDKYTEGMGKWVISEEPGTMMNPGIKESSSNVAYYKELIAADRKRLKNATGGEAEMILQNISYNTKQLNIAKRHLKNNPEPVVVPEVEQPEETEITEPITSTTDFSDFTQFKTFIHKLPKAYSISASYKFGASQADVSFGARVNLPPNCKAIKRDWSTNSEDDDDMTTTLIMILPETKEMWSADFTDEFDSITLDEMKAKKSFKIDTYTDDSDLLHKIKNRFAQF